MSDSVDMSSSDENAFRTKALVGLVVAVAFGIAAWYGLSMATQRAIDRLAAIDRVRGTCDTSWRAAHNRADTLLVDAIPLKDTIDSHSDQALEQCGDLRDKSAAAREPNPREMSGQPMPRGLR